MGKRGRPAGGGDGRSDVACFRLSPDERERLDRARGAKSRSDFVREAVNEKIERSR